MKLKQQSLECALINTIRNGHGSIYEIMILAHEYGGEIKKVDRILKKYLRKNIITKYGNKFVMSNNVK